MPFFNDEEAFRQWVADLAHRHGFTDESVIDEAGTTGLLILPKYEDIEKLRNDILLLLFRLRNFQTNDNVPVSKGAIVLRMVIDGFARNVIKEIVGIDPEDLIRILQLFRDWLA